MDGERILQTALSCGALKAAVIRREQIVLSESFRALCEQNVCGAYGRCWTCPPDCGDIRDLMARVRSYDAGVLYQTVGQLEDSFDFEGMVEAKNEHRRLSQRIRDALEEAGVGPVLHLGAGGCGVCDVCARVTDEPCRFPDRAMVSMEACGIDVSHTAASTPLKYINGQNTVTYFGLILYREDGHA